MNANQRREYIACICISVSIQSCIWFTLHVRWNIYHMETANKEILMYRIFQRDNTFQLSQNMPWFQTYLSYGKRNLFQTYMPWFLDGVQTFRNIFRSIVIYKDQKELNYWANKCSVIMHSKTQTIMIHFLALASSIKILVLKSNLTHFRNYITL